MMTKTLGSKPNPHRDLVSALIAAVGLLGLPGSLLAGSGTSGGSFLNIPVGARAVAMGEAYTALADDVSSLYWNPAGLAFMRQSQASFMYNPSFNDLTYHNAAAGVSLENGGIGASASYLSYGDIEGFNPDGD